jgi:hypothetical protein
VLNVAEMAERYAIGLLSGMAAVNPSSVLGIFTDQDSSRWRSEPRAA